MGGRENGARKYERRCGDIGVRVAVTLARCSSSYIEVPVEGAAAGPAIEPEHDGIRGRGLALALHEPVVKVLARRPPTAGGREVEIAAILPRRHPA